MTWFKYFFSKYTWEIPTNKKVIYLTFDDGPVPVLTPFVLETLAHFKAKATFFCVGDNVKKHSDIFHLLLEYGHKVGNHTYNHFNGWKTSTDRYILNFEACQALMPEASWFRPPYGKICRSQASEILKTHKIAMWSVLTKDYNTGLSPENCLKRSIKHTRQGSIVVFHDNWRAKDRLFYVLPKFLDHFSALGYHFEVLPN